VTASITDRRIRSLRPPKPHVDPYVAHGAVLEEERRPDGTIERALTVFLAGAECPFTCSFCDLWRYTIDGPTPPGALVAQLERVLTEVTQPRPERLKLYTASNFFDQRAVPPEDLHELARLTAPFEAVTVESHASTIGAGVAAFARMLRGRLEVAMGLETIHPVAAERLNKRLTLARFDRAAAALIAEGIDVRAFVLLGAPHVAPEESVEWTVRTVEHAVAQGAAVVSIIPVRGGNGEMERLAALGEFTPPTLVQLEDALDGCARVANAAVTADTWDLEKFARCDACLPARAERLRRINVSGRAEARVTCALCGGG
jgi:radical SAM enzyme (TIGR01210 family)